MAEKSTPCIDDDGRLHWPHDRNEGLKKQRTNTNALNFLTPQVVIASPKDVAISVSTGLLRRSAPRNDKLLIAFVLERR